MERYAWNAKVLPGMHEEYKKRHDAIWPEMVEVLRSAGIRNYSIWCAGDELFGYYECEQGVAYAVETQASSPVVERWNAYMADVMEADIDPVTGTAHLLREMFYLPPTTP